MLPTAREAKPHISTAHPYHQGHRQQQQGVIQGYMVETPIHNDQRATTCHALNETVQLIPTILTHLNLCILHLDH